MKISARRTVYESRKFRVLEHTLQTATGATMVRPCVDHPGAVLLLPLLADGNVVLVRQYRHALAAWSLELPAGTIEWSDLAAAPSQEAAAWQTAPRELLEETGFLAQRWELLRSWFPAPGLTNERMFLFLATGLIPGKARPEVDEELQMAVVPWEQALHWAQDGTIQDAKTLLAFWYWERSATTHHRTGNGTMVASEQAPGHAETKP